MSKEAYYSSYIMDLRISSGRRLSSLVLRTVVVLPPNMPGRQKTFYMRRRIHVCLMRRRIHVWPGRRQTFYKVSPLGV